MYTLQAPREALRELTELLASDPILALDTETTGLDPRADRVRLVQYLPFQGTALPTVPPRIVDLWAGSPDETHALLDLLCRFRLCCYNAAFDLGMILARGHFPTRRNYCTLILTKLALAGEKGPAYGAFKQASLERVAKYFLRRDLNKAQQTSSWDRTLLTQDQLDYAAADVEVLPPILHHLWHRLGVDQAEQAGAIECDALACMAWMSCMGAPFRSDLWAIPYQTAMTQREGLFHASRQYMTDAVIAGVLRTGTGARRDPKKVGQTRFPFAYDPGLDKVLASSGQLLQALRTLGYPYPGTGDDYLAAWGHPLGKILRDYREADQIRKAFGPEWGRKPNKATEARNYPCPVRNGRVFPFWRQCEAESGRMSCANPNLQQIPNAAKHPLGKQFRSSFRAPDGRELVIADFSQIELRLAAEISGDKAMLKVYQDGGDIHTEGAKWVLGIESPDKHDRQIMKSANFGLLYGAGVETFRVYALSQFGVDLGIQRAAEVRARWFRAFPGIRDWHRSTGARLGRASEAGIATRTLSGRVRKSVSRYTECLNTPVQGSGADITKIALGRIYEDRNNAPVPAATSYSEQGWYPVMVIHDEIVLEVPTGSGEAMAAWLQQHMIAAGERLMKSVPCDAEASHGQAWVK